LALEKKAVLFPILSELRHGQRIGNSVRFSHAEVFWSSTLPILNGQTPGSPTRFVLHHLEAVNDSKSVHAWVQLVKDVQSLCPNE
jgi:hypothetical protein